MSDNNDTIRHGEPTRRDYVKYGGAVIGGGLLAGCSSDGSDSTPAQTATGSSTATETSTPADESYSVTMEPVGTVEFDEPPETWCSFTPSWMDMALALGQRDGMYNTAVGPLTYFYDNIGIELPEQSYSFLKDGTIDKELFYEISPDVFLMDPGHFGLIDDSWDESDIQEIEENVAPFFGQVILRDYGYGYEILSLYEAFDKLAQVFQEQERYEAFATLHDEMLAEIQSRLPPSNERPDIGLINSGSDPADGTFYPVRTDAMGVSMKPYRDLKIGSAFPTDVVEEGTTDYETLLEVDPNQIVVHSGIGFDGAEGEFDSESFRAKWVTPMESHPVGSQLTAVEEGNVLPGVYYHQGPLLNLYQTEMAAQLFYPEEFGAFNSENPFETSQENRLFDRQRVRDIINGEF